MKLYHTPPHLQRSGLWYVATKLPLPRNVAVHRGEQRAERAWNGITHPLPTSGATDNSLWKNRAFPWLKLKPDWNIYHTYELPLRGR